MPQAWPYVLRRGLLEIALRGGHGLATFDDDLHKAAEAENVSLLCATAGEGQGSFFSLLRDQWSLHKTGLCAAGPVPHDVPGTMTVNSGNTSKSAALKV